MLFADVESGINAGDNSNATTQNEPARSTKLRVFHKYLFAVLIDLSRHSNKHGLIYNHSKA